MCLFFLSSCALSSDSETTKVVKSEDGKMELTIPSNWNDNDEELHDEAELKVSSYVEEKYVIVLNEEKSAFEDDMTLQEYHDIIIGAMKDSVDNSEVSAPTETELNGNKAILVQIKGSVNKIKVTYWVYTVESTDNFTQVIGWTLQKDEEKNTEAIMNVMNSFKIQ
ncbi:MAG: hypothetical protein BWY74_02151 [Firmicutes bacterium ADurb.Bin419]|nr:MAG: hypothetical protein BWY74_02151 [Firmicutes bacterium ADurb.Bin419]